MSTRDICIGAACFGLALAPFGALAQVKEVRYGLGTPASQEDLAKFFAIPPDGRGLPSGSGTAAKGAKVYAENCAACHGERLEANPATGIGGDQLIGAAGPRASTRPRSRAAS